VEPANYCLSPSEFNSIPASIYWTMTTISTTGYGDMVPLTWLGKMFACIIMFMGLVRLCVSYVQECDARVFAHLHMITLIH